MGRLLHGRVLRGIVWLLSRRCRIIIMRRSMISLRMRGTISLSVRIRISLRRVMRKVD